MAVKIWNRAAFQLVVPGVGGRPLRIGEAMVYDNVQYDELINNSSIKKLLLQRLIKIQNMDDMDVQFSGMWNESPHLTIGTHQYWIDATGTTRVVDGTPISDTDGEPLGSGSSLVESVYSDAVSAAGRTFAQMRSAFFGWFDNRAMGTWDTLYKHCYWGLSYPSGTWTAYQKFSTQSDLFDWMEAVIPSSGGAYTASSILFRIVEHVDTEDPFPQLLVHRNSLVASILGKYRYNKRTIPYGVSSAFNAPQYYTNYYGELGRRFVQEDTGALPATNNDNAIWHTIRVRSKHGLPKVGSYIAVNTGARGAAWDSTGVAWVSPAPAGTYQFQDPFLLLEWGRRRILQISSSPSGPEWGISATQAVTAIVFPVVNMGSPRYRAYAVYPYNYDSFATESFNTTDYELILKLVYRNTSRPIYKTIEPWYTVSNDDEHIMWSHWTLLSTIPLIFQSVLITKQPGSAGRNPDVNTYPDKVFVARRNKSTGMRSSWYPLYSIRRRVPHAAYRLLPARYPH